MSNDPTNLDGAPARGAPEVEHASKNLADMPPILTSRQVEEFVNLLVQKQVGQRVRLSFRIEGNAFQDREEAVWFGTLLGVKKRSPSLHMDHDPPAVSTPWEFFNETNFTSLKFTSIPPTVAPPSSTRFHEEDGPVPMKRSVKSKATQSGKAKKAEAEVGSDEEADAQWENTHNRSASTAPKRSKKSARDGEGDGAVDVDQDHQPRGGPRPEIGQAGEAQDHHPPQNEDILRTRREQNQQQLFDLFTSFLANVAPNGFLPHTTNTGPTLIHPPLSSPPLPTYALQTSALDPTTMREPALNAQRNTLNPFSSSSSNAQTNANQTSAAESTAIRELALAAAASVAQRNPNTTMIYGLKYPLEVSPEWTWMYPHIWARVRASESVGAIIIEWHRSLQRFQQARGIQPNPGMPTISITRAMEHFELMATLLPEKFEAEQFKTVHALMKQSLETILLSLALFYFGHNQVQVLHNELQSQWTSGQINYTMAWSKCKKAPEKPQYSFRNYSYQEGPA